MSQTFCRKCSDLVAFLKFKTLNMQFEELHQKQSQWTVPDTELQGSLRLTVVKVLLPASLGLLGPILKLKVKV